MGVDFLFSLFLNGKNGDNAYLDPATGKNIEVPEGKTLADIDPETARFYEALGDTKLTGELHTAIGDMYTSYLDIPESIISRSDFKPLETAYRNYEANATVKNAAAFLDEAGKVYARAENSGYKVGNPYDTINAAIEADFAARQGVAGDIGRSATDIGATATDIGGSVTDIGATAKAYVDTTNGVGDNGIRKVTGIVDGIKIIDGKVDGKIPVDEFKALRESSIKHRDDKPKFITLGKYMPTIKQGVEDWSTPGPDSYIVKAGKESLYFDMGTEYKRVQNQYHLSDKEMFDYFNRPALDDAMVSNLDIRFSHNPLDFESGSIVSEWEYVKAKLRITDANLVYIGGFWYVQ